MYLYIYIYVCVLISWENISKEWLNKEWIWNIKTWYTDMIYFVLVVLHTSQGCIIYRAYLDGLYVYKKKLLDIHQFTMKSKQISFIIK